MMEEKNPVGRTNVYYEDVDDDVDATGKLLQMFSNLFYYCNSSSPWSYLFCYYSTTYSTTTAASALNSSADMVMCRMMAHPFIIQLDTYFSSYSPSCSSDQECIIVVSSNNNVP